MYLISRDSHGTYGQWMVRGTYDDLSPWIWISYPVQGFGALQLVSEIEFKYPGDPCVSLGVS